MPTRLAFLLCLLLMLFACQSTPARTSDRDLEPIDTSRLKDLLSGKQGPCVLIDVRSPAKFQQAHLPGAINIPLPQLLAADPRLAQAKHIVVYASGWRDYLAPAAAKKLLALGYVNVHLYRGGLEQWQADGGQLITSADASSSP